MVPYGRKRSASREEEETRLAEDLIFVEKKTGKRRLFEQLSPRFRSLLEPLINFIDPGFAPRRDPQMFDLRYFWEQRMTNEFDGVSLPENGVARRYLLYGDKIIGMLGTTYLGGKEITTTILKGDPAEVQLAEVGLAFKEVMRVANHLSGTQEMIPFNPFVPMHMSVYKRLRLHPQFLRAKLTWLNRGFDLKLEQGEIGRVFVTLIPFSTGKVLVMPNSGERCVGEKRIRRN